jgi:lipoprotein-releasing system ATP-binding protein
MIKATGITKKYGDISVLNGVDIEIQRGELVSIIGSSGAGKSTLLHILGTLDNADTGVVTMMGKTINKKTNLSQFRNKHMGFVFQFHHLLPEFTAIENVCIPGYIAKRNKKEVEAEAQKLLQSLGLGKRLHNKPNQLSGGEQQRVAIARALINKPDIIFADEPTGNLDSKNALELHQLFIQLKQEYNQTFLIVTHNEALAANSDRILRMQDGRIMNHV